MRKLSFSLIVVVLASIVGLGWLLNEIYMNVDSEARAGSDTENYQSVAHEIVAVVAASNEKSAFVNHWNQHSEIQLSLIAMEDFPLPPELQNNLGGDRGLMLESDEGVVAHFQLPGAEFVLGVNLPMLQEVPDEKNQLRLILTLCFYLSISTVILLWAGPLVHRLLALRDVARRFGRGELSARVNIRKLSYIRDIEAEFNRMADRIESLIGDNKLLSRAVSHDLKTPLARLRFGLDALTETHSTEQRMKYAQRVNRDLEEMESLVETLLQYARLDEGRVQMAEDDVDMAQLVRSLLHAYENPEITIHFECPSDGCHLIVDKRYISMVVNNLLSNAVRYATNQVQITMQKSSGQLLLRVEDDGCGIPENERENALKPFWRGTRKDGKKGHGMGLAIVDRIAEWHGAKLIIERSARLSGASITLIFPR